MVRLVILIEGEGSTSSDRCLFVFRAVDFPDAFERAVVLGRSLERTYKNEAGEEVRWRLAEVQTVDLLGDQVTDGREVYSELTEEPASDKVDFDTEFTPEASRPTQTGV